MNIPPLHELMRHCKIHQNDFRNLYDMYVHSDGQAGVDVQGKVMMGMSEWNSLHTDGFIERFPDAGKRLTPTGVDVIKFAIMKCVRHRILRVIYNSTNADPGNFTTENAVAAGVRMNEPEIERHLNYFESRQFVVRKKNSTMTKLVLITAAGISAVEGNEDGDEIIMGDINTTHGENSPIQNRTQNSTQSVTITHQYRDELAKLLLQFRADVPKLGLSEPEAKDVYAQLATITAQLETMKPKPGIISLCLQSVWEAVKAKAMEKGGEAVFAWVAHLPQITAMISNLPSA